MSIDARFLIDLKGRQFVLYAGLLDLATRSGLKELSVRLLQVPAAENGHLAIAEACALFEDGRRFVEVGDAGPQNLTASMAPAACRMAATRAKARVLRDALNVGVCSVEELPPQGSEEGTAGGESAPDLSAHARGCERCGQVLTAAQATLSETKWHQLLCPQHQRQARNGREA